MLRDDWEVEYYEKENGRCPTQEFIEELPRKSQVFVIRSLSLLEEQGRNLTRPHVAYLRDGISELRVRTHHGQYRLLYFFYDGYKFVITHGINKKSDEVPDLEIDKAIEYRNDYLIRNERRM
jgi:phage-related protein